MNTKYLSDEMIVQKIVEIGVQQFKLRNELQISRFNILFHKQQALCKELARRPGDRRALLKGLYTHPNPQVRLIAAKNTLAIAPADARALLRDIENSDQMPQSMDAGMCLRALDQGIFKPV